MSGSEPLFVKQLLYILSFLFTLCAAIIAQDILIVPHDATSLTEEQKNSNPTILFYPLHMMGKMPEMRCYVEEEDPVPAPCETLEVNGVTFNMMCVEGGTFMMGEGSDAHQVTLSDYYIGETEVTQALWKAVMGVDKITGQSALGDDYPIANISIEQCRVFVERLSELTGRNFRIPTEAEWEYAARGGNRSKGFTYAGSDDINDVALYRDNLPTNENGDVISKPNNLVQVAIFLISSPLYRKEM